MDEVLAIYRQMLKGLPKRDLSDPLSDGHLLWMLDEIPTLEETKQHRWLGFIQGVVTARGLATVQQQADATRGKF